MVGYLDYNEVEKVLRVYELSEILELNEVTEEETLLFLVEQEFVKLPEYKPI